MPVISGVGFSPLATPDKQDGLQKIIGMHLRITESVFDKYQIKKPYIYIDAYCGDGSAHSGVDPSPAIFIHSLRNSKIKKMEIFFIDKNHANIEALKKRFKYIPPCIHIECADSTRYVSDIANNYVSSTSYGLLYIDPNTVPDLGMLSGCSMVMPKIDFLIRMNCTAGKRIKSSIRVSDVMGSTNKKFWLIRRPLQCDRWQWTFLFGTNYSNIKDWKSAGFYNVNSEEGIDILNHLEYTNTEKKELGIVKNKSDIRIESYNIFEENI